MEKLRLPLLEIADEHIFYVLEGATLQMFGEESYPVFMRTAYDYKVHSLAHTAVNDFVVFTINETEQDWGKPAVEWSQEIRRATMLQSLCVRRCLFAPIYEMLADTCGFILDDAIAEERLSGDSLYRDAIGEAINERFVELDNDVEFSKYLEDNDAMHQLQLQNLHRTFNHCEEFAKRNGMRTTVRRTIGTADRCAYIVTQFPFIKSIMKDYLTRDIVAKTEETMVG